MTGNIGQVLAKKLQPIFARQEVIDDKLNEDLPIDVVKGLGVELAILLKRIIDISVKNGFPKQQAEFYCTSIESAKASIISAVNDDDLHTPINYLLSCFTQMK